MVFNRVTTVPILAGFLLIFKDVYIGIMDLLHFVHHHMWRFFPHCKELSPTSYCYKHLCSITSSRTYLANGYKSFKQHNGSDTVIVGNGARFPTTHVDHNFFYTCTFKFILNDVLIVPDLHYNLVWIRYFSRDNSCSPNFYSLDFCFKIPTQKVVHCCSSHGPHYPFLSDGGEAYVSPPLAALVSKLFSSI